jgi:hypothetical protein
VNEADKTIVQNLREKFTLTEKQVVSLLIGLAVDNMEVLETKAEELRVDLENEKTAHKEEKLAQYKAKATAKRKAKSVEKLKEKLAAVVGEDAPEVEDVVETPESAE